MEVVWPSAGRALELLRGSKVTENTKEVSQLSAHPVRHKRSADQALGAHESFALDQPSNNNLEYPDIGYLADRTYSADAISPLPRSSSMSPYHDYYSHRDPESGAISFPGTLSTSVLPQLYSTGLAGSYSSINNRLLSQNDSQQPNSGGFPPQFWNDFTSAPFPQLGTAYTNPQGLPDQNLVPQTTASSYPAEYMMYSTSLSASYFTSAVLTFFF